MDDNKTLEAALVYYDRGYSIFPCKQDKTPLIKWQSLQQHRASRQQITDWWTDKKDRPIAIVTGKISGIVVVDVDDVDIGFKNLKQYISPTIKTPMSKTPTGGYHLYFLCPKITVRNNARLIPGCDFRGNGGYIIAVPSFCQYEKNGKNIAGSYEWVDESGIDDVEMIDLPDAYLNFISDTGKSLQKYQPETKGILTEGRRDDDLFHIANSLVKGKCHPDITEHVLRLIADSCVPPYLQQDVQTKIKSAMERAERKNRNLAEELREWIKSLPGHFIITDFYRHVGITEKEHKNAVSAEAIRLQKNGTIKHVGNRRGEYIVVDAEETVMDWRAADDIEYPILFPLGIHNLAKIYAGNIIIIAGASNTGKTSFLLETVRLNQKKHEIVYFNSEMGASELRVRLQLFSDVIEVKDWSFVAVERSQDFGSVIRPDAINIIDFMEIYDNFWAIGEWIKDIHEKLDKGIAIIAIQKRASTKNYKQDYGRGGEFSLDKSRLYVAMDNGFIKIVKAKAWKDHNKNPNGLTRRFNIISGWKFVAKTEWEKEKEDLYKS